MLIAYKIFTHACHIHINLICKLLNMIFQWMCHRVSDQPLKLINDEIVKSA